MKKLFLITSMIILYTTSSFALWTKCDIPGAGNVSYITVYFDAQEDCLAEEYIATYYFEDGTYDIQTASAGMGFINFGTWDCCPYY